MCEDMDISRALKLQRAAAHQVPCAEARDLKPVTVEALSGETERELAVSGDSEVQNRGAVGARKAQHEGSV